MTPGPGDRVSVVFRKWPDRPHWRHEAVLLGEDEHGSWLGAPPGTSMSRPGAAYVTDLPQVSLVPADGAFVATFFAPGRGSPCAVYVDIATVPCWLGATVTAVDLDLDVVRGWTGRTWVDDEDEFADHRVRWSYPPELVRLAAGTTDRVLDEVRSARAPYDGSADAWLDVLADVAGAVR